MLLGEQVDNDNARKEKDSVRDGSSNKYSQHS